MRPVPEDLPPPSWSTLEELLAGYFAARARGPFASEFVLSSRGGERFGRLRIHGPKGAQFEAGSVKATAERTARSRYRMPIGDTEMLVAEPAGPSGDMEVRCGNRLYETRFNLLRNTAMARPSGGEEAARIAGGLTNLSYEAFFARGSLPVAVFLLYRLVALRRRAFVTGMGGGGATQDHD